MAKLPTHVLRGIGKILKLPYWLVAKPAGRYTLVGAGSLAGGIYGSRVIRRHVTGRIENPLLYATYRQNRAIEDELQRYNQPQPRYSGPVVPKWRKG